MDARPVPIKRYLQKQAAGCIWLTGSLLTSGLHYCKKVYLIMTLPSVLKQTNLKLIGESWFPEFRQWGLPPSWGTEGGGMGWDFLWHQIQLRCGCSGLNYVLPTFLCWSPNLQCLRCDNREIGSLKGWWSWKEALSVGPGPIWLVSVSDEHIWTQKESRGVHAQRKNFVKGQQEGSHLQAQERGSGKWTHQHLVLNSQPPDCEKISVF